VLWSQVGEHLPSLISEQRVCTLAGRGNEKKLNQRIFQSFLTIFCKFKTFSLLKSKFFPFSPKISREKNCFAMEQGLNKMLKMASEELAVSVQNADYYFEGALLNPFLNQFSCIVACWRGLELRYSDKL
jgi:hypothetical protein